MHMFSMSGKFRLRRIRYIVLRADYFPSQLDCKKSKLGTGLHLHGWCPTPSSYIAISFQFVAKTLLSHDNEPQSREAYRTKELRLDDAPYRESTEYRNIFHCLASASPALSTFL